VVLLVLEQVDESVASCANPGVSEPCSPTPRRRVSHQCLPLEVVAFYIAGAFSDGARRAPEGAANNRDLGRRP